MTNPNAEPAINTINPAVMFELGKIAGAPLVEVELVQTPETIAPVYSGEFVKSVPTFLEQVADETRTNQVSYLPGQKAGRGTKVDQSKAVSMTEHEALQGLHGFLEQVSALDGNSKASQKARSMMEGLTFIGEREYDEATAAIAADWKRQLAEDDQLQIWAVTGVINKDMVKSDQYMLDAILKNFTDEEVKSLKGRVVFDGSELKEGNEAVEVVLLDDWTNSAMQLGTAAEYVVKNYPDYAGKMKAQLIVATADRLKRGVAATNPPGGRLLEVPVSAYYVAHTAQAAPAHITGAHSSLDFDFENEFGNMVYALDKSRSDESAVMPPLTNVARPYRQPGYHARNIERARAAL